MIEGRAPSMSSELARAHKQWAHVTARQRDVLRWLAHGLDNPGIAAKLRVGTRAIKAHISALLAMFGLESRTQLALLAHAGGLMPPSNVALDLRAGAADFCRGLAFVLLEVLA